MSVESEDRLTTKRGQQLATALSAAVRTASYYEPGNDVFSQAGGELLSLLNEAREQSGSVSFSVMSHCIFVNKSRVSTSLSTYGRFNSLIQLFADWRINTLVFEAGLTEPELQEALMLLSRTRPSETESLSDLLAARRMTKIRAESSELGTGNETRALNPLLAYSSAMHLGM